MFTFLMMKATMKPTAHRSGMVVWAPAGLELPGVEQIQDRVAANSL